MNEQVKSYQKIKVQTASPAQLIFMLYDGAIKFMNLSLDAMEKKNIEEQNKHLTRSQRIVAELQISLDLERGGQIAERLNSLYDYMYRRLIEANAASARGPVEECIRLVTELKEAWATVVAKEHASSDRIVPARVGAPEARPGGKPAGVGALDIAC